MILFLDKFTNDDQLKFLPLYCSSLSHIEINLSNPFPLTLSNIALNCNQLISLKIYDVTGRLLRTLIDGNISAGNKQFLFDGKNLPSGVYFYNLNASYREGVTKTFNQSAKMILLK